MSSFEGGSRPEVFCHLVDLLSLSKPAGLVAMLDAFIDAGKDKHERLLTVAIVAYGGENAKKAHRSWQKIWGDTVCHMTDLHNRPMDVYGWDAEQVKAKFEPSISVLKQRATYRVAVSCDVHEYAKLAPTSAAEEGLPYLNAYRTPYAFCCHMAMASLAEIAQRSGDHDGINYVLEAGDEHQGQLRNFINFAESMPQLRNAYGIRSHIVATKPDARLLEGAYILAWEWTRHIGRAPSDKLVRKSLQLLLGTTPEHLLGRIGLLGPPGYALHYTGDVFARDMDEIASLMATDDLAGWKRARETRRAEKMPISMGIM